MTIAHLSVQGLRNLSPLKLDLSPQVNLIHGANGSGKTSLLEAVYLLSLARSFRTTQHRHYLQSGTNQCTLFMRVTDAQGNQLPVGFQRTLDGEVKIRIAGDTVAGVAALAELLPVQLINAETFALLEGSPAVRRQFIDWGGFHAEPRFLSAWKAVRRCLKQRNSLLKHGRISGSVRAAWDRELVQRSEELDRYRGAYLDALLPRFNTLLGGLLPIDGLQLTYYRGWDRKRTFDTVLAEALERDIAQGFTHSGPQRADLRLRMDGVNAVERLSRGQQKLVVSALKLAQGFLLQEQQGRRCVYLVDDLPAELDANHRQKLCQLLEQMQTQVLITGTDTSAFNGCWQQQTEVRHFSLNGGMLTDHTINGS